MTTLRERRPDEARPFLAPPSRRAGKHDAGSRLSAIGPVRLGAERQQGAAELAEGRQRDRKDNLGFAYGDPQIAFVAFGLADGDRRGGDRGTLPDRTIRNLIAAHDADLADRNQQEGDEMLHVGEREREAHGLSVRGRSLDQQRIIVGRRAALRVSHKRIRHRADFEPFVHERRYSTALATYHGIYRDTEQWGRRPHLSRG